MSHDLVLELVLDAPPEKLYRGWTEPELMKQWFAPRPWTTPKVDNDLRPGGRAYVTMASPEGQEFPNNGIYLEHIPNQKIVFTDAFTEGWKPAGRPFFVGELTFTDLGSGKTKYRAVARHWTEEAKNEHEKMGFHGGWEMCARQLEALTKTF
jgi:uncharacterized protein YndB with AHSA1/START domain